MIMNQDIKPEKQAYYLGAKIIEILKQQTDFHVNIFEVFTQLNKKEKVSDHAFAMGMNWLYLIGVLTIEGEVIKKCF